jgi:succinyl-diaminopimelate desuccinylase
MGKKMTIHFDKQAVLEALRGLLQIKSVNANAGATTSEAPLGTGINTAINYVLELGKSFGLTTKNCDGYCGYVEFGEGPEMVAAITHVDTVEVGDDWTVLPFDLTIDGDKIYGRGVLDDKGPTIVSLFALKALKEAKVPINKRIRLIIGGDEEGGNWACMKRYKETEEIPTYAFSPDSGFPVIFAEKGIMNVILKKELDNGTPVLNLSSGKQINSVPDYAKATYNGQTYEVRGKSAHASEPQKGDNALIKLADELRVVGIKHSILELLKRATPEGFGINLSDSVSGNLTLNPAIAFVDENIAVLRCDIRYPVTIKSSELCKTIQKATEDLGFSLEMDHETLPLHVDQESFLVTSLQKVYADYTGDTSGPIVSGGGTYARAFDNAVAFGGVFPGETNTCHQTDESWSIDSMAKNFDIIVKALEVLAQ